MRTKTIGFLMQVPALLLLIASFFAGIYAAVKNISGIGFNVPVILAIIVLLYFYGRYLERKSGKNSWDF